MSDENEACVRLRWLRPLKVESDTMLHLDALRFVASAGIVWHHSHEFLTPVAGRAAVIARTHTLAIFVDLFFVISGYVITHVYSTRITDFATYLNFLQRRIGRLIPLHWLTLAISLLVWTMLAHAGLTADHAPDLSAKCVAHAALLLNGLFSCGNGIVLNGVTWSISAEMVLYILFPLMLVGMRRGWLWPLGILTVSAAAILTVRHDGRWDNLYPVLRAVPSFIFGMALFRWRHRIPTLQRSWPVIILAIFLFIAMTVGASQLLILGMTYILAALAVSADKRHNAPFTIRKLSALGQLTYSIYMWHSLFILIIMNGIGDKYLNFSGTSAIVLQIFCCLTIIAFSYLSLNIFETPARRWIDKLRLP